MTRRAMLGALARACAGLLIAGRASARATGPHPDPRPGIDASHLPPRTKLAEHPDAVPAYDEARTIPESGQRFAFFGYKFEVLRRQRNQVTALKVTPPVMPLT